MNASNWSVYLILCENSAFYCGISPNPQQRLAAHTTGKGAKYTRVFKPVAMRQPESATAACRPHNR